MCSQVCKDYNCYPRLFYPAKLFVKIYGEIEVFHSKDRLQECMTIKPALQKLLGRLFQYEQKSKHIQEVMENCPTISHATHSGLKLMCILLSQCIEGQSYKCDTPLRQSIALLKNCFKMFIRCV